MNLKAVLFTLLLLGGGLSWPLKAKAEPPTLAQVEEAAASSSYPGSSSHRPLASMWLSCRERRKTRISTSTLLRSGTDLAHERRYLPAVDEADLFEYYLVAIHRHPPEFALRVLPTRVVRRRDRHGGRRHSG
jgi:hypothetical protein